MSDGESKRKVRITEVNLDHALAETLLASPDLQELLLSKGRFARFSKTARLLSVEQAAARKNAKHWWKHWWCRMPDGSEGETDIFLVFQVDAARFALHIENKPMDGKLTMRQASSYRQRAAFKAFDTSWLDYADFETVILAPLALLSAFSEECDQFDVAISYEEVGQIVPLFGEALMHQIVP